VRPGAQQRHRLVGDLVGVADRAVPQQTPGERSVVDCLGHRRAPVVDAGRQEHRSREDRLSAGCGIEQPVLERQSLHPPRPEARAVPLGLGAQPRQKLMPGNALGEPRLVVRQRDHRRPALAGIDHQNRQMKTREIDRGGQPGRSAADDKTVERRICRPGDLLVHRRRLRPEEVPALGPVLRP
jgi:hypothetical protein